MSDNKKPAQQTSAQNNKTTANNRPIRTSRLAGRETDAQKIARICALKLS